MRNNKLREANNLGDEVAFKTLQSKLGLESLPSSLATQTGIEFIRNVVLREKSNDGAASALLPGGMTALAEIGESVGQKMDTCQVCVYTLERIKQGYQFLLPAICVELFSKEKSGKDGESTFGICHQVLSALSVWGNNVRHWFHYGCYKSETYGAMELIRPCPSHVICSQMANFEKTPFCNPLPPDKLVKGKKPTRL